jgi:hypothetical protein
LPDLAEAVAGTKNPVASDMTTPKVEDLYQLGQHLVDGASSGTMALWARWFFKDRFAQQSAAHPVDNTDEPPSTSEAFDDQTRASTIEALHANPSNAEAWRHLSNQTRKQRIQDNPFQDAQTDYYSRKAIALNPSSLDAWLEHLEFLIAAKRNDSLPGAFQEAFSHHPDHPQFHWMQAEWLDRTGQLPEAANHYRGILRMTTNRLDNLYVGSVNRLRELTIQQGDPIRAQKEWLQAKEIPNRPDNVPVSCIDLSPHYNAALHEPWHNRARPGNDLSRIPPGPFLARGIAFDVRGNIQLAGINLDITERG